MPVEPPSSSSPEVRASDAERNAMVRRLAEHAGAGRLTLDEQERRSSEVLATKTRGELEALLADLPADEAAHPPRRRKPTRWVVSVMGAADKRGRWRVGRRLTAIAVMGGNDLDLRHAELDADEVTIVAVAVMGNVNVYVPDSVDVDAGGFSLMGSSDVRGSVSPPRQGAPHVRVLAYPVMGDVSVWRLPEEARGVSLREARKLAKRAARAPQPM